MFSSRVLSIISNCIPQSTLVLSSSLLPVSSRFFSLLPGASYAHCPRCAGDSVSPTPWLCSQWQGLQAWHHGLGWEPVLTRGWWLQVTFWGWGGAGHCRRVISSLENKLTQASISGSDPMLESKIQAQPKRGEGAATKKPSRKHRKELAVAGGVCESRWQRSLVSCLLQGGCILQIHKVGGREGAGSLLNAA